MLEPVTLFLSFRLKIFLPFPDLVFVELFQFVIDAFLCNPVMRQNGLLEFANELIFSIRIPDSERRFLAKAMTSDIMNFLEGVAPSSPIFFNTCGGSGLVIVFVRIAPLFLRIGGVFITYFMENFPRWFLCVMLVKAASDGHMTYFQNRSLLDRRNFFLELFSNHNSVDAGCTAGRMFEGKETRRSVDGKGEPTN